MEQATWNLALDTTATDFEIFEFILNFDEEISFYFSYLINIGNWFQNFFLKLL
jgi:hypothetical protein